MLARTKRLNEYEFKCFPLLRSRSSRSRISIMLTLLDKYGQNGVAKRGTQTAHYFFLRSAYYVRFYEAPRQRSVRNSLGNTPYDTNEKKLLADNCVTCLFALSKERSIGLSFVLLQKGLEDEIAQKFTRSYSSAKNIFFVRDGMFLTHVGTVFCYYGKNTMH